MAVCAVLLFRIDSKLIGAIIDVAVQPIRFSIIEELGCYNSTSSIASFAVEFSLPVIFSLVSAVLAGALYSFT